MLCAANALTEEIERDQALKLPDMLIALYSHAGNEYGYREEGRTWMFGLTWTPEL